VLALGPGARHHQGYMRGGDIAPHFFKDGHAFPQYLTKETQRKKTSYNG